MELKSNMEASWARILKSEFESDYFCELEKFLIEEEQQHEIFPPGKQVFEAFSYCPFEKTKLVILGQDPYHGEGQAHGLSFSVPKGIKTPPSLRNIMKELKQEYAFEQVSTGDLSAWAKQGVLLLNAILSVRKAEAASHRKKGWEQFTDACISSLSAQKEGLVFMFWGNFAQSKSHLIDEGKHLILKAAHPSPLSAYNGFFGCNHFKLANAYLKSQDKSEIDWKL